MGNDNELKEKDLEQVSGGDSVYAVAAYSRLMNTGICPKCNKKILGCQNSLKKSREHLLGCLG